MKRAGSSEEALITLPDGVKAVVYQWIPKGETARKLMQMQLLTWERDVLFGIAKKLSCRVDRDVLIDASGQRNRWLRELKDQRRRIVPCFRVKP